MKTAEECFKILRKNKDTSMATVGKDGTSRVRIILYHCGRFIKHFTVQAIISH